MYVTEQCLGVHEEGSGSPSVAKFSVFLRNQAEKRLQEERERIDHYLDPSTEAKIREVTEKEMIAKHMRALAEVRQHFFLKIDLPWIPGRWRILGVLRCFMTTKLKI